MIVYDAEHGSFEVSYRERIVKQPEPVFVSTADNAWAYQTGVEIERNEIRRQRLACEGGPKTFRHTRESWLGPAFVWGKEPVPPWPPCPRCGDRGAE